MCSQSLDLFKFWEISGNVLETVQKDTQLQLKTTIGNRMWPIECYHYG